jgi:hypothetical protein
MVGRPETQCYFSRELIVQSARPLGIEAMVDSIDCAALPFGQRLVRSAVVFGGAVYHGKDAVTFIASLTNSRSWAGSLLSKLLRSPTIAAILYPIMKLGRRITLKALRKPLLKI